VLLRLFFFVFDAEQDRDPKLRGLERFSTDHVA
jgi:hypothetical protein